MNQDSTQCRQDYLYHNLSPTFKLAPPPPSIKALPRKSPTFLLAPRALFRENTLYSMKIKLPEKSLNSFASIFDNARDLSTSILGEYWHMLLFHPLRGANLSTRFVDFVFYFSLHFDKMAQPKIIVVEERTTTLSFISISMLSVIECFPKILIYKFSRVCNWRIFDIRILHTCSKVILFSILQCKCYKNLRRI